jgi:cytochrome c
MESMESSATGRAKVSPRSILTLVVISLSAVKARMPLGQGGTLRNQEAYDVAAYFTCGRKPADARY